MKLPVVCFQDQWGRKLRHRNRESRNEHFVVLLCILECWPDRSSAASSGCRMVFYVPGCSSLCCCSLARGRAVAETPGPASPEPQASFALPSPGFCPALPL